MQRSMQEALSDEETFLFKVYPFRWCILGMFCSLELTNALFWVTFSPISDITQHYFNSNSDSYYGSTTAVNMLANIFLIMYLPGTILGVIMMKYVKLRKSFILAGLLTVVGGILRYIATSLSGISGSVSTYWLIFLGQAFAALAQPMFLNMPPAVASVWFPVNERDIATTVGSMCSPVGNALGQILPIIFVSESKNKGSSDDDSYDVKGMEYLMLAELIIAIIPLVVAIFFFKDAPPTPPSQSTKLKLQNTVAFSDSQDISYPLSEKLVLKDENMENLDTGSLSVLKRELALLWPNRDYWVLFFIFSIGVGFFNSLLTLLNQLVSPYGYSNDDAGTFGAVFIFCGLAGAAIMSYVMEKSKAYRQILTAGLLACFASGIFFVCMLFGHNFWPLIISFAVLGSSVLPLLPVMMENCAEVTYPVSEDVAMGLMFTGCNIVGLVFIFVLQSLIDAKPFGPPPFTPSNAFIVLILLGATGMILFYRGNFKRMHLEHKEDKEQCHEEISSLTKNPIANGNAGELSGSLATSNLVRVASHDDGSSHAWSQSVMSGRQSTPHTFWSV